MISAFFLKVLSPLQISLCLGKPSFSFFQAILSHKHLTVLQGVIQEDSLLHHFEFFGSVYEQVKCDIQIELKVKLTGARDEILLQSITTITSRSVNRSRRRARYDPNKTTRCTLGSTESAAVRVSRFLVRLAACSWRCSSIEMEVNQDHP